MDRGACYPISAEWLIMAKRRLADHFVVHMSFPAVYEQTQDLRIPQTSARPDALQVETYIEQNGLELKGTKHYVIPSAADLARDVTHRVGHYIVGISAIRPIAGMHVARDGHALAVVTAELASVYDPNFGMASFPSPTGSRRSSSPCSRASTRERAAQR